MQEPVPAIDEAALPPRDAAQLRSDYGVDATLEAELHEVWALIAPHMPAIARDLLQRRATSSGTAPSDDLVGQRVDQPATAMAGSAESATMRWPPLRSPAAPTRSRLRASTMPSGSPATPVALKPSRR